MFNRLEYYLVPDKKPTEAEFQPIEDENALIKGANLVAQKYEWLNVGKVKNGFINFQAQLSSRRPILICEVIHEKMDVLCLILSPIYIISP